MYSTPTTHAWKSLRAILPYLNFSQNLIIFVITTALLLKIFGLMYIKQHQKQSTLKKDENHVEFP